MPAPSDFGTTEDKVAMRVAVFAEAVANIAQIREEQERRLQGAPRPWPLLAEEMAKAKDFEQKMKDAAQAKEKETAKVQAEAAKIAADTAEAAEKEAKAANDAKDAKRNQCHILGRSRRSRDTPYQHYGRYFSKI